MIRLHMVVEGQTEEAFINTMLAEHLARYNVFADVRCVQTSRRRGRLFRGGLLDYARAKKDLELWIKEDRNPDAYFTTMFDLYALPQDFPSYDEAKKCTSAYQRVALLEQAFSRDIGSYRFVPYIQLHEFEALILVDPAKFDCEFINHAPAIRQLESLCAAYETPELINDGSETAPSKRIMQEIPEYKGRKTSAGPRIAAQIGLAGIQQKCPHFRSWLQQLEALGEQ